MTMERNTRASDPGERLLSHYERITGSKGTFTDLSPAGSKPSLSAAVYDGFPGKGALTGFTVGLSHAHSPASEGHPHRELVVHMADQDPAWAFAVAFLAYQLQGRCGFDVGDALNFKEQIAASSAMTAFLVIHPRVLAPADTVVDLGIRSVSIRQLLPLYEEERAWLMDGGDEAQLLARFSGHDLINPRRPVFRA
jgi:hypothetical protein